MSEMDKFRHRYKIEARWLWQAAIVLLISFGLFIAFNHRDEIRLLLGG
jgi:hypothetical protein